MPTWLYAAADNFADAETTYNLAHVYGVVWRSFYANRLPPQAIPNVRELQPGDTLYLGYRANGTIRLIGRMQIGHADNPLDESTVFCIIPPNLVGPFQEHGYGPDPFLNSLVGIFVCNAEPLVGPVLPSQGRNAITRLDDDPLGGAPVPAPTVSPPPTRPAQKPGGTGDEVHLGVDVSKNRGLHLCYLSYHNQLPHTAEFENWLYPAILPPTAQIRAVVQAADWASLAAATYTPAQAIVTGFRQLLCPFN